MQLSSIKLSLPVFLFLFCFVSCSTNFSCRAGLSSIFSSVHLLSTSVLLNYKTTSEWLWPDRLYTRADSTRNKRDCKSIVTYIIHWSNTTRLHLLISLYSEHKSSNLKNSIRFFQVYPNTVLGNPCVKKSEVRVCVETPVCVRFKQQNHDALGVFVDWCCSHYDLIVYRKIVDIGTYTWQILVRCVN